MTAIYISALIVAYLSMLVVDATSTINSKALDGSNGKISGQTVVDLGNQSDQPALRLIGTLIMNLEKEVRSQDNHHLLELICRLHNCTEWAEWSKCSADNPGEFGVRKRDRLCGLNTSYCQHLSPPVVKHERKVCQNPCASNCTEWGAWSSCILHDSKEFGNRTRSRRCDFSSTICEQYLEPQDELESKVCKNIICPNTYTTTPHGFCLKVTKWSVTRDVAEANCRKDGGHLPNIDSEQIQQDVNSIIVRIWGNRGGYFWVDGRRSVQSGPWEYGYTPERDLPIWAEDEPSNGSNELCRQYSWMNFNGTKAWSLNDHGCNSIAWYFCRVKA